MSIKIRFDADAESMEKVESYLKKCREHLHSTVRWKTTKFLHLYVSNISIETFWIDLTLVSNSAFLYPYCILLKFVWKVNRT